MRSYLRDPAAITKRSFEIIAAEVDTGHLPSALRPVAHRIAHASGMTDVVPDLRFSPDVAEAAAGALAVGAPVLADCAMVVAGISRARLPCDNVVESLIGDPRAAERAAAIGNTRSAAAVDLWADRLAGAVVAIGNAPTALFRLLELLDGGCPRPAAILGFPVGFVGAAESKAALADDPRGVPFLTLLGRRGGSAMAAAAVNALAKETP